MYPYSASFFPYTIVPRQPECQGQKNGRRMGWEEEEEEDDDDGRPTVTRTRRIQECRRCCPPRARCRDGRPTPPPMMDLRLRPCAATTTTTATAAAAATAITTAKYTSVPRGDATSVARSSLAQCLCRRQFCRLTRNATKYISSVYIAVVMDSRLSSSTWPKMRVITTVKYTCVPRGNAS